MMINAEIVAVGTELLLGQIANTNAQWISQQLAARGISVYHHQVVGDNEGRMSDVFKHALRRSQLIFITGGLGPTDDDISREVVAKLVDQHLIEDEQILAGITAYFARTNRQMSENNYKQAKIIKGAEVIPNSIGTAPGMIVPYQEARFILLPGVPSEMKQMMIETVLPYLEEIYALQDVIVSKMLRCVGIGESQLEMQLKELIAEQTNPTIAPLASDGEVALRLTAMADSTEKAKHLIEQKEQEIKTIAGKYIYGSDDQTLNEVVVQLLKESGQSISSAESLTGGRFADSLVSISGASHVFQGSIVSYTSDAKENVLGIEHSIIEQHGMVSEQTAYQMAKLTKEKFNTTYGISFTGVAGPAILENKAVGTVYICLYRSAQDYQIEVFDFPKNRELIRNRSVKKGLELVYNKLK
ncbi:competence/damage-inducible protein A [Amphibacillus sp. Q70]|uniref:competence/damage-inducible protein A n=1 Tax=Amphibacillus sp. Q70 TaxID=3453416 RepID=UPI003F832607